MPPGWLNVVAYVAIVSSIASAAIIALDIVAGRRQKMAIMNLVWPITALYLGPIGLWAYWAMGRPGAGRGEVPSSDGHGAATDGDDHRGEGAKDPVVADGVQGHEPLRAGCTVGDVIGETAIFFLGITLFGSKLGTAYLVDFVLAYAFGIVFQYFTIAPMRGLGLWDGLKAAIKADTISLGGFRGRHVRLHGLEPPRFLPLLDPEPNSVTYWFLMQLAMIVGFATSYPANWWLVKAGLKEAMYARRARPDRERSPARRTWPSTRPRSSRGTTPTRGDSSGARANIAVAGCVYSIGIGHREGIAAR